MHMFLATRGIKHDVDRFITILQGQFLSYSKSNVQLSVRPFQLWELIFPEEHLQTVWRTVQTNQELPNWMNKMIRIPLKAKKIPKFKVEGKSLPFYKNNIATYPIGIKEDDHWPKGKKATFTDGSGEVDLSGLEQL